MWTKSIPLYTSTYRQPFTDVMGSQMSMTNRPTRFERRGIDRLVKLDGRTASTETLQ